MIIPIQDTPRDWTITSDGLIIGFIHENDDGSFSAAYRPSGEPAHMGGTPSIPLGTFPNYGGAQAALIQKSNGTQ